MNIETIKVGALQTNCYILSCNGKTLVIDPGDDYYILKRYLMEKDIEAILITHGHEDHIGAVNSIVDAHQVPVYSKQNLQEGKYEFGPFRFEVIYTPGHTIGSVSLYCEEEKMLFSGDTLFRGSWGRTDLPTSNFKQIVDSITNKLMILPEETIVYPGHREINNNKRGKTNIFGAKSKRV